MAAAASWTRAGLDRLLTLQTVFRLRTADAILPEDWSVIDKGQLELWHEVVMEPATACHRGVEHVWHEQRHTHRNVRLLQVQNLVRVRQKPTDEFDIMVSHQHYATQHTNKKKNASTIYLPFQGNLTARTKWSSFHTMFCTLSTVVHYRYRTLEFVSMCIPGKRD